MSILESASISNKRNILIITNDFPPPIDSGNIRVYKFAKYLLKHGWEVHIICNSINKYDDIIHNEKLSKELFGINAYSVPDLLKRYLTKRGNVNNNVDNYYLKAENKIEIRKLLNKAYQYLKKYIVPDVYRFTWNNDVYEKAKEIVIRKHISTIITSSPPQSTHLIGYKLKEAFKDKIYWVLDFRDLWSLSPIYEMGITKNKALNIRLEKKMLSRGDKIIVVSNGIKQLTSEFFKLDNESPKKKIEVITNGYDPEDFQEVLISKQRYNVNSFIKFGYIGSIDGARSRNKYIEGIYLFLEKYFDNKVMFNFIGELDLKYKKKLELISSPCINYQKYVPHNEALRMMSESDVLVLILSNDKEGSIAFTGKFFEYLKIGRPILAIVPEGEVSSIIRKYNLGEVANPDDPIEICNAIERLYNKFYLCERKLNDPIIHDELLDQFNRENLTKKLEEIILTRNGMRSRYSMNQ